MARRHGESLDIPELDLDSKSSSYKDYRRYMFLHSRCFKICVNDSKSDILSNKEKLCSGFILVIQKIVYINIPKYKYS